MRWCLCRGRCRRDGISLRKRRRAARGGRFHFLRPQITRDGRKQWSGSFRTNLFFKFVVDRGKIACRSRSRDERKRLIASLYHPRGMREAPAPATVNKSANQNRQTKDLHILTPPIYYPGIVIPPLLHQQSTYTVPPPPEKRTPSLPGGAFAQFLNFSLADETIF